MVLSAADGRDADSQQALERLCQTYWPAIFAFILRRGHAVDDAKDLTQEFFGRLLEGEWLKSADADKGRFRTFLLTAVTRFMSKERERAGALKRGGGCIVLPLALGEFEEGCVAEPTDPSTPEDRFERQWAETLIGRVMDRLRREFDGSGRPGRFDVLKSFITDDSGETSYEQAADRIGVSTSAVRSGIHRLRQRYGELIRDEIGETVASPDDVQSEIRHLLAAIGG